MQFFKHMSNMSNNLSIKRLIRKYGLEGYGLYCYIIERIVYNLTTDSPFPNLDYSCEDIADETNVDVRRVSDIANFMINEGLLTIDEVTTQIQCKKVYKYLDTNQTRSKEIRDMINNFKSGSTCLRQSKTFVKELELELELDKELDIDIVKRFKKPSIEEIDSYIKERQQQQNKIYSFNAEMFYDYYESKGWYIGKNKMKTKMKDWKAAIRTWERNEKQTNNTKQDDITKENDNYFENLMRMSEEAKKNKL